MKLLFDQNISHRIINQLSDILPESRQIRQLGIENHSDKVIWNFAKANDYTIVTFDADFYDFSIIWGHPPKIVWLRSYNQTTTQIETIIREHPTDIQEFLFNEDLACLEIIA